MRVSFGDCVFDSDTRQLLRDGRPIALSPKAFTLLELLISQTPRAVPKGDLRAALWPDVHVAEANLTNLVVEIRDALGDDARRPRFIRTVPRYGYAFVARTSAASPPSDDVAALGRTYRLIWGRREIDLEAGENLIGRHRGAVVWIDDESVSRRHARISIADGGAWIEDLGSKNGTFVGDRRVTSRVRLNDGDHVRFGSFLLTFRVAQPPDATATQSTSDVPSLLK